MANKNNIPQHTMSNEDVLLNQILIKNQIIKMRKDDITDEAKQNILRGIVKNWNDYVEERVKKDDYKYKDSPKY